MTAAWRSFGRSRARWWRRLWAAVVGERLTAATPPPRPQWSRCAACGSLYQGRHVDCAAPPVSAPIVVDFPRPQAPRLPPNTIVRGGARPRVARREVAS